MAKTKLPAPDDFDPLDYANLAAQIVDRLQSKAVVQLSQLSEFLGAGVYAIYLGKTDDGPYAERKEEDIERPLYVGKAVPAGARKGGAGTSAPTSRALYNRLKKHVISIAQAKITGAFSCRWLCVKDVWIPFAERSLIENYKPVWNLSIEGFGINVVGKHRENGTISWWDALHSGRPGRGIETEERNYEAALQRLKQFYQASNAEIEEMAERALDVGVGDE